MGWDLLGHDWAAKILIKHLANNEARHAYLFTGAPGIGRRSLALAFAQAINCTQPPAPGESCGVCRVCQQTVKMQQADMSIIEPDGDAEMIKVDQIRGLQHSLSLTPYEAKYRIALLLNFQRANQNAQNALLKTLEEAPRQVILLLTADSAENLLPTISSRCEILRLRPVAVEKLEKELQTRWNITVENARLFAHIANGRTGMALGMAEDPSILEKRTAWLDEFIRLLPLNRRERFAAAAALARDRGQVRMILQVWLSFARDLLLAANGQILKVTNIDHLAEIKEITASLSNSQPLEMVNSLAKTLEMLEQNANIRLMMDNLMLEIPKIS